MNMSNKGQKLKVKSASRKKKIKKKNEEKKKGPQKKKKKNKKKRYRTDLQLSQKEESLNRHLKGAGDI